MIRTSSFYHSIRKNSVTPTKSLIERSRRQPLSESWEKSYDIIQEANKKIAKNNKDVAKLLKNKKLSMKRYQKIKALLESEAAIRNEAIQKIEKIHRENTKNFEQQYDSLHF